MRRLSAAEGDLNGLLGTCKHTEHSEIHVRNERTGTPDGHIACEVGGAVAVGGHLLRA